MSEMQEKSSLTRDEVLAALPGYVLEALEPEEMRAVEHYLQQHPDLITRMRELDAAASALAYSAPAHVLPAATKQRVMARVREDAPAERRMLGARTKRTPRSEVGRQKPTAPAPPATPRVPVGERRGLGARMRRWWVERRYANVALATAGALAVLLIIVVFQAQAMLRQSADRLSELQAQVGTLESENQTLRSENELLQDALINQQAQWATILAAGEAVALAGTEDAPGSQAVIYVDGADLLVFAAGLAELAEGETYQLWLIPPEGDPISAGVFDPAPDGTVAFQSEAPWPWDSYAEVGVSVEPAGGSPTPTGPIVLLGDSG
jgi:anti-sigma-K factor RskA/cell division protein FtsB